jgi:two-component system, NtrC family, sensor kinase
MTADAQPDENERLRAGLREAEEQLAATSEILRVIGDSPTDAQPVFDAIVRHAARLCEADFSGLALTDGAQMTLRAAHGLAPPDRARFLAAFPIRLGPDTVSGRAILEGGVVHVRDQAAEPAYAGNPGQRVGTRTIVAVPMLRRGRAIGAISAWRREVRLFTDTHIALLRTFADQAVIAIENVRLFKELEARNGALVDALEQQTATAEVLSILSTSPTDLQPVLDAVVKSAARFCGADNATIFQRDGDVLRVVAHHGPIPVDVGLLVPCVRGTVSGRTVLDGTSVHVTDLQAEATEFPEGSAFARRFGHRTTLSVPLLREETAIGAIQLRRPEVDRFTDRQAALLQTFADQAVIAIENVRLFQELGARNRDLTETLEQQAGTAEVLRVISSSPTDLRRALAALTESAARLCGADHASVYRLEDGWVSAAASYGPVQAEGQPLGRGSVVGRAVVDCRTIHVHDLAAESDAEYPEGKATQQRLGHRTVLATPLLREGRPIGALAVWSLEVRPFSEKQVAVLQTFADQAVIAIENVRLFEELEARTRDLTRSVGELRALGEVGQAISSTLDLHTVLSTIVARATQLSGADAGVIYEYDEPREVFLPRATERLEAEIVEAMLATPVRKGEGAAGRLAEVAEPVQLPDVEEAATDTQVRRLVVRAGYRALLAVPLVREGHLLGGLLVIRKAIGAFPPETVELVQTFATQSALAIQNARLFRELADKSHELEVASQHKSEFLANMSHELRTPLNAIIGFSEVLSERLFGELNDKQDEYLRDIYASGQHLLSLINDILDLSKIEAGRMELEVADFDLPTAIDNALALVRERAGRRGIKLGREIDQRVGMIQGDERKVKQVLLNLLSNALKFTPESGRIDVRAAVNDGVLEISVADTGVGIAPEDQEAIFEEFHQVGTADRKVEGTGLGLALSRKFVELHGGRIWVKSQLGAGATFTFTIPVRHSPPP